MAILATSLAVLRLRAEREYPVPPRLAESLDALGKGTVDMPARHQTLRATVEWSVGLLDDAKRSLLETAAVFVDGWTIEAATEVAGIDEDQALDLTEAPAGHSLISLDVTERGPRSWMLDTTRAFRRRAARRRGRRRRHPAPARAFAAGSRLSRHEAAAVAHDDRPSVGTRAA